MQERMDYFKAAPEPMNAMLAFEKAVRGSGLEHSLFELVKTRASQINGCAYCIHMHTSDARRAGESQERLYLLSAWRESSLYTPRERAALDWTETLTLIAQTAAPDDVYENLRKHFDEEEIVKLTLLIGAINVWNRIAVGFRSQHPVNSDAA
ncbi:MAG: carboxymuconolactone decarboxylase family protein [Hyphomicrobiales bacterium]|nr:carboxymuconolactone decarboxylase family protein [Hyphomicrobiales bacterium]MCP4999463.1 carboxymuconolactone decarboxylase family protein [Hyphomicrobiales bacterium]